MNINTLKLLAIFFAAASVETLVAGIDRYQSVRQLPTIIKATEKSRTLTVSKEHMCGIGVPCRMVSIWKPLVIYEIVLQNNEKFDLILGTNADSQKEGQALLKKFTVRPGDQICYSDYTHSSFPSMIASRAEPSLASHSCVFPILYRDGKTLLAYNLKLCGKSIEITKARGQQQDPGMNPHLLCPLVD